MKKWLPVNLSLCRWKGGTQGMEALRVPEGYFDRFLERTGRV